MDSILVTVRVPQRRPFTLVLDRRLEFGREGESIVVADSQVSRRHVALQPQSDGRALVLDLDSSNGTTVDGVRVDEPTLVTPGSVVRIGNTTLEIGHADFEARPASYTEIQSQLVDHPPTSIDLVAESISGSVSAQVLGVEREAGTLTIVFSDIESSTTMAVALGDREWFAVLQRHHALVSAHVEGHGGRIVKHQGDGYMMCFRSARAALLSSIGIQRDLARVAEADPDRVLRVRMGLHTGEVLVGDDGDLFGKHVVVAARIASLAQGGEILVSSLVRQIAEARGDLPFSAPRAVELRGIGGVEMVSSLEWRAFDAGQAVGDEH
jgi:class 3 adenylate cyclase